MNTEHVIDIPSTAIPQSCQCYAIVDNQGCIQPALCSAHRNDYQRARASFRMNPKYSRYFETEMDALDRVRILKDGYPGPGYDLTVGTYPVGRWHLVLAKWHSTE